MFNRFLVEVLLRWLYASVVRLEEVRASKRVVMRILLL
jgi:hypothetical protein